MSHLCDYYSPECGKRKEAGTEVVLCAGNFPQLTFTDPRNNRKIEVLLLSPFFRKGNSDTEVADLAEGHPGGR